MPVILPTSTSLPNMVSCYEEIKFELQNVVPNAVQVSAEIYVVDTGTGAWTLYDQVYSDKIHVNYGGGIYGFSVDISDSLQSAVGAFAPTTDGQSSEHDLTTTKVFKVEFFEWRLVGNILSKDYATIAISAERVVTNAVREHTDWMFMDQFGFYPFTVHRFMTDKHPVQSLTPSGGSVFVDEAKPISIGLDDDEMIPYFADWGDMWGVVLYNSNGTIIEIAFDYLIPFYYSPGGTRFNALKYIPCGTKNLRDKAFFRNVSTATYNDTLKQLDSATRYVIFVGLVDVTDDTVPIIFPEPFARFEIDHGVLCDEDVRVRFMNKYGKVDYITMNYFEEKSQGKPKKKYWEKPRVTDFNSQTHSFRSRVERQFSVTSAIEFTLVSKELTDEGIEWIVQIVKSPIVEIRGIYKNQFYVDVEDYIPVTITKGKFEITEDEKTGLKTIEISGNYSNQGKVQRV